MSLVKNIHLSALFFLMLGFLSLACPALSKAQEAAATAKLFAGQWLDASNPRVKMSVRADSGLYRITGGDEAYGYNLACLAIKTKAMCTGDGGRLEGQNFLYQSSFVFNPDGTIAESWKAFNNLQTVTGRTVWKRQQP